MYPAQTSLIPVAVALARFVETNGLGAMLGNYPYWYLGTTPFRFLTGPILPITLFLVHKLIPQISLFMLSIYLIAASFLLGAYGWGVLAARISESKKAGFFVGVIYLLLPWKYISAFAMAETSQILARNILPIILLIFWNLIGNPKPKIFLTAVFWGTLLFLINTEILPVLSIGIISLIMAASFKEGKFKGLAAKAKYSAGALAVSLALAGIWYSPGFWFTVLANPSIGGGSLIKVLLRLFDLFRAALPVVLAVGAVYLIGKIKSRFIVFASTWIFAFFFLTIFRYLGNIHFWMDWTAWFWEVEVGVALIVSWVVVSTRKPAHYLAALGLLGLDLYATAGIYRLLAKPALISSSLPATMVSLAKLNEVGKGGRVFISGSGVFWLNAFYDVSQVRGGRDEAAVNPIWNKGAYELREGTDPELSSEWIRKLGVRYVLIHSDKSSEFYRDFKNLSKWEDVGTKIWEERGDIIYSVR